MTVRKSVPMLVKPLLELTTASSQKIKFSPFDKGLVGRTPPSLLLVFERPIHEAAETIKRALSQALVHYYPIAGRVVVAGTGEEDDDEAHIDCNGEGVAFVAATASCAVKEVEFSGRSPDARMASLVDELAVYYPAGGCSPSDPLLLMQVTQFSCGGFVLGVTWNHGIADGAGMSQFLHAIAELSLGRSPPPILPFRWDDSLMRIPPPSKAESLQLVKSLEPMPFDLAFLGITLLSSSVNRIRQKFSDHSNGQTCTAFEAIVAVLWQCRTRAIVSSNPDSLAVLHFVVNVRKYVGAKDGYYGNCISPQPVMATSGAVANTDIMDVVRMIKRAKEEIPSQFKRKKKEDNSDDHQPMLQPSMSDEKHTVVNLKYNMLAVISWRNLGFEKADFGAGTPARVVCCAPRLQPFPLCVVSPRCEGKDDDGPNNVFCLCVKDEHAGAFLRELARFTQ